MARTLLPADGLALAIHNILATGPRAAAELTKALGISQPTLSRTILSMPDRVIGFRVTGQRTPLYGLLRPLPMGLSPRQRIHQCLGTGQLRPFADVAFLAGGGTLEAVGGATTLYDGLPPYMAFAAPSGFMGRHIAQQAARSAPYPASLRDWSDEHRVAWLFSEGLNLPGNLVFGDGPLQREMDLRGVPPVPAAERGARYVQMAASLKSVAQGSSAGGDQPKFVSLTEGPGHVIVKFARKGTRMAELLPLEHLALRALGEVGVSAAHSQLLAADDYVFLEVTRFDRVGLTGRVGLLSAGAVDDERFGQRDSWSQFATRCVQARLLKPRDALQVDIMAAFSELIGNTDRHFENISLLIGDDGRFLGMAPAYDILPMRYAPIGGGLDPDLSPIEPRIGSIGSSPAVWEPAARAAERFWAWAQTEKLPAPISAPMRRLAARNLEVARGFAGALRGG